MNTNIPLCEQIKNRQKYNKEILSILNEYIEKYPELRFGQLLSILTTFNDHDFFNDESYDTLEKIKNKITNL